MTSKTISLMPMLNRKSNMFRKSLLSAALMNKNPARSSTSELPSMTYLCRFQQRNRLIEVPLTSEFSHQHNGISHEHLRQLIVQEFRLRNTPLIIQLWNEQYQDFIDIESFKRLPWQGRLQVFVETTAMRDASSINNDRESSPPIKKEHIFEESISTISAMESVPSAQSHLIYDLLTKPSDGIPIPRFPPHIAAFLNGNGDANQLNALVQALYQEIVKYELYPNADELRSIVSRLVDRHPHCVSVIGSVELLVRKLYYKFCNERKKYPIELKRRQPNKRKRLLRDDEGTLLFQRHENLGHDFHQSSLDHLMHLWTSTTDYSEEIRVDQQHSSSSSSSSSNGSSHCQETSHSFSKSHPLNLSTSNHLICPE